MKKYLSLLLIIGLLSCSNDDSMTTAEDPSVVAEFKTNLSELNLYKGNLSDLNITSRAFEYELNTPLFSDYSHKQRFIALPQGTSLEYDGDGLPIFPEKTVIAKTFFYNVDERDLSLGKNVIETRILIKINGSWETGDYKWNAEQTEAVLDLNGSTVAVTWIDEDGSPQGTDYKIPSNADCFTCHQTFDNVTPIGPKLRNLNFSIKGSNQLDQFINNGYLTGITSSTEASSVVNWTDTSASIENRARAYFDINCAHCHVPGGQCDDESTLNLDYNTPFGSTQIFERRFSISARISDYVEGFSMPFIGTTMTHTEGVDLLQQFLDTL